MKVSFAYLGHSSMTRERAQQTLCFAPNLTREKVAFDAPLLQPLRFREAISALHDIVINDLRFKKRDKTAYQAWLAAEKQRVNSLRQSVQTPVHQTVPADVEETYHKLRRRYWRARDQYSAFLQKNDPALWRQLMPCDPIVTVAPDCLLFECFSADESSYGCMTISRNAFGPSSINAQLGTTNVDYSQDLYNHFQSMRSYRQTRFRIDPEGFESATAHQGSYREEKIDLPPGWLRGLMQIQSAMSLPSLKIPLSREVIYSLLAFLRRHKARTSPRAIRFELQPGQAPVLVLEPWEIYLVSHGTTYQGPPTEPIRIWGRNRLLSLARMLPLADAFEVHLLGTGLPTFWIVRMGEMALTLGLSGWTTNDWTASSAIDLVAPPHRATPEQIDAVSKVLQERRSATIGQIATHAILQPAIAQAALRHLAHSGQAISDLATNVYRFRQIMPRAVGEAEIGPEHPELIGAKEILARSPVKITSMENAPRGGLVVCGQIDNKSVEIFLDGDRNIRRGTCPCSYYHRFLLRNGPCRHMIVLRRLLTQRASEGGA